MQVQVAEGLGHGKIVKLPFARARARRLFQLGGCPLDKNFLEFCR
jgi:hypothetical protein